MGKWEHQITGSGYSKIAWIMSKIPINRLNFHGKRGWELVQQTWEINPKWDENKPDSVYVYVREVWKRKIKTQKRRSKLAR